MKNDNELKKLKEAAMPLVEYLSQNYHPHVTAIITGGSAELVEGLLNIPRIVKEEVEAVEDPKPWPQVGDEYFVSTADGCLAKYCYDGRPIDIRFFKRGNAFRTREEAELVDQVELAVTKIKNYARQQWGEFKPNWGNWEQKKWIVGVTAHEETAAFCCWNNILQVFSPIGYFRTEEHADEIIEKFPEELEVIRRFYT